MPKMKPSMSDRDLTVLILAFVVAIVVGTLDALIDISPEAQDGVLTVALVFGVAWGFYKIR